jgi:hypothetical protein
VGGRSDLGHVDRADHRENTNSESKNDSAGNPERTEKKASVGASANKLRSIRLSTKGLQKSKEGSLNLHHLEVLSTTLDGTSYEADDTTDEDGALSGDLVGEVPREESADESATGKDRDDSYRRRKKKKRHRQRPQSGSGRVRRAGKKGRTSGLARIDGVLSVGLEGTHVLLELLIGYDRRTFFFSPYSMEDREEGQGAGQLGGLDPSVLRERAAWSLLSLLSPSKDEYIHNTRVVSEQKEANRRI